MSGDAHSPSHQRDAGTAAAAFVAGEGDFGRANAVRGRRPLSLIGAAALWAGWTGDVSVLRYPK